MQSIILTVNNKAWLIDQVIEAIYNNTVDPFELIVVLDGCTDNSEEVVTKHLRSNGKIFYTPDVYETIANNVGLKNATGEYVIIVQDDMIVNEVGWDQRLRKPILTFPDIFAVTARTAHSWAINYASSMINDRTPAETRPLWECPEGQDIIIPIDLANRENMDRQTFAIRQSVNRGPLMIKHDDLRSLNYLDEVFAPFEMDDHDLCYRAQKQLGKFAGSYWIDFISELEWGGTRKPETQPILLRAANKNAKILFERHEDLINRRIIENRHLS